MEDGVRFNRIEDGAHDVLVGEREDLRGDAVYFVSARPALLYAVMTQLSRRTCDEDLHSNLSFLVNAVMLRAIP